MNIKYRLAECPKCGISFQKYFDELAKKFEAEHGSALVQVRNRARYKGIVKGFLLGILVGTMFLLVSWDFPQPLAEHLHFLIWKHPLFVSLIYMCTLTLFILIEGMGKVNSRAEQKMWEQFVQEHSKYLQLIP